MKLLLYPFFLPSSSGCYIKASCTINMINSDLLSLYGRVNVNNRTSYEFRNTIKKISKIPNILCCQKLQMGSFCVSP